jgi:hypothetical protein
LTEINEQLNQVQIDENETKSYFEKLHELKTDFQTPTMKINRHKSIALADYARLELENIS